MSSKKLSETFPCGQLNIWLDKPALWQTFLRRFGNLVSEKFAKPVPKNFDNVEGWKT